MRSLRSRLQQPLLSGSGICRPAFLHLGREGPIQQQACSTLVFIQSFVLWVHQGSPWSDFLGRVSFFLSFFLISLAIPRFGLLSHISSLRLFSWHSGPVVTLRTDDAACTSLPSPRLLVADKSIWATSPLAVVVRHVFCGLFFFLPVMLPLYNHKGFDLGHTWMV